MMLTDAILNRGSIHFFTTFGPKKLATLKGRGRNFGDMFFDVFQPAESKSEISLSHKTSRS
ncbi:hypothetical protein BYT27DRAFT_6379337 [Phlegmacium glaucopus]|nr:hypothetical protein BYT27DRAFT_6661999 [Phlegmacium glaucopus]KAF8816861.1 hypothetical protein BYT27DRAFT_6379337 [Phlegmacium glaucopus]